MSEPVGRLGDMIFLVHTAILLVAVVIIAMALTPLVADAA